MTTHPRPELPPGPYLVVGLARSGAAAIRALAKRGQNVVGADSGNPEQAAQLAVEGFDVHTSVSGLDLLDGAACVVKSPGVPPQAALIAAAVERGIPVIGELELGWRMIEQRFVAVTGTNGKTTTVELLGEIFRHAGVPVAVAGNVGTALCELADQPLDDDAIVICETSSFQLEDSTDFAPECAALLNITPDHLDRHGSIEHYRASKLRIFANQTADDFAVAGPGMQNVEFPGTATRVDCITGSGVAEMQLSAGQLIWRGDALIAQAEIRLRGRHNIENAMVAAACALSLGVSRESVKAGLTNFAGVRHRLQEVATIDGILFVNDSKATNVEAARVGIDSFEGNVHLILGGTSKGATFKELASTVAQRCKKVYLIGDAADQIRADLEDANHQSEEVEIVDSGDLENAVEMAYFAADPGDTVLLSPACASFDQFRSFEHRGDWFIEVVRRFAAG